MAADRARTPSVPLSSDGAGAAAPAGVAPAGARRASYGLDAPGVLPFLLAIFVLELVLGVTSGERRPFIAAAFVATVLGIGLHTTLRGKFLAWRDVLDGLQLRGDERVLDLGCGRGAVLILAAQRLPRGRATGIDIWRRKDQSGNGAAATRRNAELEGVADRIEIATASMTALPFAAATFDVITANVAIHNIPGQAGKDQAIDEAVRVLRPGGRLVLADVRGTRFWLRRLAAAGMVDVARRNLGWRMWWGAPWGSTRLVTATKPAAAR